MAASNGSDLRIGELAERIGLNPKTIRYYEEIGLLPAPDRSPSGYRLYRRSGADEDRLRFIKTAQHLGLSLGEVKEVLGFRDRDERPCRYVASVIEQRLREVNQRMRELRALKQELGELRERMRVEGVSEGEARFCHYIEGGTA